ncbi:hypothetical protein WA026_018907 [Henosepilachna vigintioctopunctata]|uniref:Uncharacterized protein n=1 Tax=Henosepilachna vigintioctopunctata TaxID=420089 RepID=A0AAW1UEJ5_9CUCU
MNAKVLEISRKISKNEVRQVKPSTELLPDEYDVLFDGKECVHIFVADEDLHIEYVEFLKTTNIEVPEENIHLMQSEEQIESILEEVSKDLNDTSALILLFWGYSLQDGKFILDDESHLPFYKMWTPFLATSDMSITNVKFGDIPKVFFFNVIKSEKVLDIDGVLYEAQGISPYQKPNEADLLIIYKHNKDKVESIGFIQELAELLKEHGKYEDLCSIVSIIDTQQYTRPIIISTLLKKFYMIPSQLRGHYLNFETNQEQIMSELQKIEEILNESQKEKQHRSPSFMRTIRKRFPSFRNKGTHNRETLKEGSSEKSKPSHENPTTELLKDKSPRPSASGEILFPRNSTGKIPAKKVSKVEPKRWIP